MRVRRNGVFIVDAMTTSRAGHSGSAVQRAEAFAWLIYALQSGLTAGLTWDLMHGTLLRGQTSVLMSDRVIVARSPKGALYGSQRLPELTRMPAHASTGLAQRFGQEADIMALTRAEGGQGSRPDRGRSEGGLRPSVCAAAQRRVRLGRRPQLAFCFFDKPVGKHQHPMAGVLA